MSAEGRLIHESSMKFGPIPDERLFYIEQSEVYKNLGQGYRCAEFVWLKDRRLYVIEAKSSSPRPAVEENGVNLFNDYIQRIADKFNVSWQLFLAAYTGRQDRQDMGYMLQQCSLAEVSVTLILIIHGHKTEWLPPLQEALSRKMAKLSCIWRMQVAVINDQEARARKMIA